MCDVEDFGHQQSAVTQGMPHRPYAQPYTLKPLLALNTALLAQLPLKWVTGLWVP